MLGCDRNHVIAAVAAGVRRALDRQVVRLGRAAGEDDFAGGCADERGDLASGAANGLVSLPPIRVLPARGIAELLGEVRQHRLEHARIDRCRGVVVEIDRLCHGQSFLVKAIGEVSAGIGMTGTSDEISCSEQVASAETMRSRMRQSGSRTLHFAY